ncbi:MAG: ABC transporter substrate-binding protein [Oscillospiraceae bacterium]|nr:ABC transporter substrate-binding protein [Oscillospiraceae bacterium]
MKKFIAILLIAVMLVSMAACGSSSSDVPQNNNSSNSDANNEVVEVAQGVTDTTITVANSVAVSGAYGIIGRPLKLGMEAYFKMYNDAGGANGRKVEYIHEDDIFEAEKGANFLKKFVEQDKVFAIVGHFGTPVVSATLDYLNETKIPAVYFGTGIGPLYNESATVGNGKNLFPVQPIYNMEGRIMTTYAKGYFSAKKIGVLYTTDDAGKDFLSGIEQEAQKLGLEVVAESVEPTSFDLTSQIANLKECDIVIAACLQATFPLVLVEMEKQSLIVPVITSYVNVSAVFTTTTGPFVQKLMKSDDAGIYGLGWADMSPSEDMTMFTGYMTSIGANVDEINSYSVSGWIAASFFCEGLTRVGDKPLTWDNYI